MIYAESVPVTEYLLPLKKAESKARTSVRNLLLEYIFSFLYGDISPPFIKSKRPKMNKNPQEISEDA